METESIVLLKRTCTFCKKDTKIEKSILTNLNEIKYCGWCGKLLSILK